MSSLPSTTVPLKAQVLYRARNNQTLTRNVTGEEAIVGRDPQADVSIPADGVSRQHAKIDWDGKNHWISDLKSTNGTYVNGQRVVGKERLQHLDVITLGKNVDVIFVLRADTAPASSRLGILKAVLIGDSADATAHEIPKGEVTIGRSSTCNIVLESGAVSKVHARVERTTGQLVLEDLGSANGTFVNGARTMTAVLKDGDQISFAGVESLRVVIEVGEITSGTTTDSSSIIMGKSRQFSPSWKTRLEWDPEELKAIADLHKRIADEEARAKAAKASPAAPKAPGHKAPAPKAPPSAAVPPKAAATPPAPKPQAQEPAKPSAPVVAPPVAEAAKATVLPKPAAPSAAPPETKAPPAQVEVQPKPMPPPPAPSAREKAVPTVAAPAELAKPILPEKSPVPPAEPEPPPPPPPAAQLETVIMQDPEGGKGTRIATVRLTGEGFDLSAKTSGAHELGRARDASLRVDHPTVSRHHARIIISEDRTAIYVQDIGGTNGTKVNGKPIEKIQMLNEGDTIGIGDVSLKVSFGREGLEWRSWR